MPTILNTQPQQALKFNHHPQTHLSKEATKCPIKKYMDYQANPRKREIALLEKDVPPKKRIVNLQACTNNQDPKA